MHKTLLFWILLLGVFGCKPHHMAPVNSKKSSTVQLPAFDMEGHRGARGLRPENTIPAMLKALDLGVTTLEMDAHISRDGKVLLSHDPYFNREHELLPNGQEISTAEARQHILYQLDYQDIRKYDVGSKLYKKFPRQELQKAYKPLLAEVIDSVQTYIATHNLPQVFYNIETKSTPSGDGKYHPAPEKFVDKLLEVILEKEIQAYTIIQSFDVRTLQVLHQKYPQVKTSLLVENLKSLEQNLKSLGFTPDIYSPNYKLVTPALLQKAHEQGIKVIPWTVNSLQEIKDLKAMGVDGVISDYPDLFQQL